MNVVLRETGEGEPAPLAGRRVALVTFGPVLRPDGGLAVRARSTIEALVALGAHVSVVSDHEPDGVDGTVLGRHVDIVALGGGLRWGFSRQLVKAVRAGVGRADLVVVESALLLPAVLAARPRAPIVWDTNECETLHYQRLPHSAGNRLRGIAWRLLEGLASRRAAVAVAISEAEAASWRRLFPRLAGRTVAVAHRAHAREASPWRPAGAGADTTVLLFVGNAIGKHNAVAAAWLSEVLAPALPGSAVLVLAGPGTDGLVLPALGPHVIGLGFVDDIDAVIAGADLCLAPLPAGAGVKTKVLHYLAHGKAVIATPAALEGIEDAPGVTVAEMEDFAGAVQGAIAGLRDSSGDHRWSGEQQEWLAAGHGADVVAAQWRQALLPLLAPSGGLAQPGAAPSPPRPRAAPAAGGAGEASVTRLVSGLRAEVRNWLPVGVLGWVVLPSRCPPRGGLLDHKIAQRRVTVRLRSGGSIICRVAELFAVTEVFALATYDRPGVDWSGARTIVDVGANVGAATVWMARRAPNARVVAVEPSPAALVLLRENIVANGLVGRVMVVGCAIAAAAGEVRLRGGATSVSGRVVSDATPADAVVDMVAARTLSSVLDEAGIAAIDILKLDCEGAEFDIIETMPDDDLARVGAVVGEYHTFNGRQPAELGPRLAGAGLDFSWSGGSEIGIFSAVRRSR